MTFALKDLIAGQPDWRVEGDLGVAVRAITADSREARPGCLFVAIPGARFDGHDHVSEAIAAGASAVVIEHVLSAVRETNGNGARPSTAGEGPHETTILVPNARVALAELAATFHAHPSEKLHLYGVTGTNGKTTITYLLEALFTRAGESTGVLGTINYRFGGAVREAANTTPDALVLQRTLAEMVDAGVRRAVMEVSSHALVMHRVRACQFRGAIFTNLTQDH
ncbi:MAG: UDP-N-acetylmuramoyl-L-alanyl-D-glutamate--2,6-diaminopimelate ligase, partial [Myxococcales bacterium]|nr:UDP-N-acetylmuramoyl-L-alanyl-D-glutamate--2,6-diaminopimelate ligase [Myxococcales bacterium]